MAAEALDSVIEGYENPVLMERFLAAATYSGCFHSNPRFYQIDETAERFGVETGGMWELLEYLERNGIGKVQRGEPSVLGKVKTRVRGEEWKEGLVLTYDEERKIRDYFRARTEEQPWYLAEETLGPEETAAVLDDVLMLKGLEFRYKKLVQLEEGNHRKGMEELEPLLDKLRENCRELRSAEKRYLARVAGVEPPRVDEEIEMSRRIEKAIDAARRDFKGMKIGEHYTIRCDYSDADPETIVEDRVSVEGYPVISKSRTYWYPLVDFFPKNREYRIVVINPEKRVDFFKLGGEVKERIRRNAGEIKVMVERFKAG
jgi:hypothetical protein